MSADGPEFNSFSIQNKDSQTYKLVFDTFFFKVFNFFIGTLHRELSIILLITLNIDKYVYALKITSPRGIKCDRHYQILNILIRLSSYQCGKGIYDT